MGWNVRTLLQRAGRAWMRRGNAMAGAHFKNEIILINYFKYVSLRLLCVYVSQLINWAALAAVPAVVWVPGMPKYCCANFAYMLTKANCTSHYYIVSNANSVWNVMLLHFQYFFLSYIYFCCCCCCSPFPFGDRWTDIFADCLRMYIRLYS